jgi:hypothetical protein
MDRVLNGLSSIDWESMEQIEGRCRDAVRELSRPGALRELLSGVAGDRRLLGLSERFPWGDRLVLVDDPATHWRVRLHRFEEQTDDPHSHRWPFHTRILHGSYRHLLFGTERSIRSAMESGGGTLPPPSLVRIEAVGSSYAIDDQMVHVVQTKADTISLVVQGPQVKNQSLRIRDGSIVTPGAGARPSLAAIRAVRTSSDRVAEIAELAYSLGLTDSERI